MNKKSKKYLFILCGLCIIVLTQYVHPNRNIASAGNEQEEKVGSLNEDFSLAWISRHIKSGNANNRYADTTKWIEDAGAIVAGQIILESFSQELYSQVPGKDNIYQVYIPPEFYDFTVWNAEAILTNINGEKIEVWKPWANVSTSVAIVPGELPGAPQLEGELLRSKGNRIRLVATSGLVIYTICDVPIFPLK